MKTIAKNRYLDALLKVILLIAVAHDMLFVVRFIQTGDVAIFNIFRILDLQLFFPGIEKGSISNTISMILLISLYVGIFSFFSGKQKR